MKYLAVVCVIVFCASELALSQSTLCNNLFGSTEPSFFASPDQVDSSVTENQCRFVFRGRSFFFPYYTCEDGTEPVLFVSGSGEPSLDPVTRRQGAVSVEEGQNLRCDTLPTTEPEPTEPGAVLPCSSYRGTPTKSSDYGGQRAIDAGLICKGQCSFGVSTFGTSFGPARTRSIYTCCSGLKREENPRGNAFIGRYTCVPM